MNPTLKRMLTSLLTIALSVYLLLVVLLYVFQARFLYFPSRDLVVTPEYLQLEYEDVNLLSSNGNTIHGWYIDHPQPRARVLFFHGNGGNISHRLDSLKLFHDLGLATLIIDYQGYGQSQGNPSEQATYDDALAALEFIKNKGGNNPGALLIFGRSLGGAVATWLAERHPPTALILESTFTSVMDVGRHYYPFLPVNLLTRYQYASSDRIASIHCPVLIVHSPDDEIIPYRYGERLFELANEPKSFLKISGGHNDGFLVSGEYYREGLETFLNTHLPIQTKLTDWSRQLD